MVTKRTGQNKEGNMIMGQAMGVAFGTVIILLGSALITWLILNDNLTIEMIAFAGWIIMFTASFLGSMLASRYIQKKQLLNNAVFAAAFSALCLIVGMLFFNGFSSRWWSTIISIWSGAGVYCLLSVLPKKNKRYHKMRHG